MSHDMKTSLATLSLFAAAFIVAQCTTACRSMPWDAVAFVAGPFVDMSEPEEIRKAREERENARRVDYYLNAGESTLFNPNTQEK